MRARTLLSAALLLILMVAGAAQQAAAPPVLIKAGRLLDVRAGAYRASQGIWIEAGRIRQVGAFDEVRAAAPANIAVLDLGGAAVLPGLIDAHAHLLAAMDPASPPGDNLILTLTKDSPARRALRGAAMAREIVEGGFTTVRNVGHSGVDGDVALRDAIRSGYLPGPRIVAAARKVAPFGGQVLPAQSSVVQSLIDLDFLTASTPAEGRRAVQENVRVGADVIKVVADDNGRAIDDETMRAIADEAHKAGRRVAVHATSKAGVQAAVAAGVDSIEHGDEATDEQFLAMRGRGIAFDPTIWPREILPIPRTMASLPNLDALAAAWVDGERAKLERARRAGVKIVFGSDMWFAYPERTRGQTTRFVLEALQVSFGMPPADVLRSATVHAAELLAAPGVTGAIEANAFGDLIAVDGDPLQDIRALESVRFVMKGGTVIKGLP